ncbi:activin receptor type-1C [Dermatophagoides farinae]|uniref:activin receptor type-1C n=1 Tax=Dermatophagoides farinae TaxID=6954 RepID=UPI003F5E7532
MVATKCRCRYNECPDDSDFGTCHLKPGGYCYTFFEEIIDVGGHTRSIEKRFGCFSPGEGTLLQCKGYLSYHDVLKNISCCNSHDYCNDHLLTQINDGEIVYEEKFPLFETIGPWIYMAAFLLVTILLLMVMAIFINYKYRKYLEKKAREFQKNDSFSHKLLISQVTTAHSSPTYLNISSNVSDYSGGSSGIYVKYPSINTSQNISNYTMESNVPSYHCLSSVASNTTSSFMSENTQQTVLSSQKISSPLPPVSEDSITSGSGSGVPRMVQSTIAKQIDLKRMIGEGRFGRVYHGVRHCEHYAVKIFFSIHESSWRREVDIYQGIIMRHENIVTFLAADIISNNGCTQLWLVTEYHELGSLFDYLNRNPIKNVPQMISIMRSIIFGLSHLHLEVIGTQGKPRIAHRDIKSKNILMKSDYSCCISDFASATTKALNDAKILSGYDIPCFGTVRYMAPEILNNTINMDRIEEFLYTDIYSLGLVYWEILNRLQLNDGSAHCYSKPYQEYVSDEPTFHDICQTVCIDKHRPTISHNHQLMANENLILFKIINLIQECWTENRFARLTSLRLKKTIIDLQRDI